MATTPVPSTRPTLAQAAQINCSAERYLCRPVAAHPIQLPFASDQRQEIQVRARSVYGGNPGPDEHNAAPARANKTHRPRSTYRFQWNLTFSAYFRLIHP